MWLMVNSDLKHMPTLNIHKKTNQSSYKKYFDLEIKKNQAFPAPCDWKSCLKIGQLLSRVSPLFTNMTS